MSYRKANSFLLVFIVCINAAVIIIPFIPAASYAVQTQTGKRQSLQTKLDQPAVPVSHPDSLTIPKMLLDQPVYDGTDTYALLNKGVLHWPASSTPDKGGNTVLLGHRFTYHVPKGVFYFLDKVAPGDEIGLVWHNQRYVYTVTGSRVVAPTDTSILANTADSRLTLYTCTPLYWPKERLVVTAELESSHE